MNDRPLICQLLHSLDVGGAEVLSERMARRLSDRFRFLFVCLDREGSMAESLCRDGFTVLHLGRREGVDWRLPSRLSRILRQERVSIIHAHQYTPFFYALATRLFGCRIPIVFTEHGRFHPDFPSRKRAIYNCLLLGRQDRIVGVGEAVRQALIRNEGLPEARVDRIYNGIDPAPYVNGSAGHKDVRSELGVRPEDFMVLHVARLDPIKDHATAIRAVRRAAVDCPHIRLLIVGEGPEQQHIEEEVRRQQAGPFVRFLGLRRDVPRLLSAADALLLTSVSEGIPLTIIEAMAAGLPVVATRVGGVPEVVVDAETGFLAPAGSDGALAGALVRLATDSNVRASMGTRARHRACTVFSEERMHGEYARLFEGMLRG